MNNTDIYKLHANMCKALAHPSRIEIISLLEDGEKGFADLLEQIKTSKSSLSQHLSIMNGQGILQQRREGVKSFFKLSSPKVAQASNLIKEVLIEHYITKHKILTNI